MVASTDIKWFTSDNLNAPQLTNDWGVLIGVLDACLINGLSVQSIASLTASGTTVTATFNTAHQYKQYQVIEITGAAQAEYNVQARILTVPNANSITFELASAPSVTTATGTITCKLPAMDWEKAFSGTQKAAYRSKNTVLASRPFLRVDNSLDPAWTTTYAKYAKVGIVESMTDIDTMSGVQAPYDAAAPTKNWVGTGTETAAINGWAKWVYATSASALSGQNLSSVPSAGSRRWIVVGTKDNFYLFSELVPADTGRFVVYGFGAFDSAIPNDSSNSFLCSWASYLAASNSISSNTYVGLTNSAPGNDTLIVSRKYDQSPAYAQLKVPAQVLCSTGAQSTGAANYIAAVSTGIPVYSTDIPFYESANNVPRGTAPSLRWLHQSLPYTHGQLVIEGNEVFLAVNVASTSQSQILVRIG